MTTKTWVPIAEAIMTDSSQTTIEFPSIPSTYSHLVLSVSVQLSGGASTMDMIFNDNSPSYTYTQGDFWYTSGTGGQIKSTYGAWRFMGDQVGISNATPSTAQVEILNYTDTTKFKAGFSRQGQSGAVGHSHLLWRSGDAISKITIRILSSGPTFNIGSAFTLWGIN